MSSGPPLPYTYSWTPTARAPGSSSVSGREFVQIAVAFAVLTLDFILILSGAGLIEGGVLSSAFSSVTLVIVAALTAMTAFVAHEMAHKVSAQSYGYWAEFRWSPMGLVFSLFTAYLGFLFAAPGATVVAGMTDRRQWGRTALAGPLSNFAFGAVFYAGALATWYSGSPLYTWLLVLAYFNCWFGTFNLFPFGPLDGAKVMRWSPATWAVAIVATGALAALSGIALFFYGNPVLHP
jgi:Zn-dependent protease